MGWEHEAAAVKRLARPISLPAVELDAIDDVTIEEEARAAAAKVAAYCRRKQPVGVVWKMGV